MVISILKFLFFEIVSIAFFFIVHVTRPGLKEYSIALLVGFISGLVLFISSLIIFPAKRRKRKQIPRSKRLRRNMVRPERQVDARTSFNIDADKSRQRHFQDTDKIYIDREEINGSRQ
ncbi:MAG: hypothetical protein Q4E50_00470 [Tissierellia bacterium]|nr:hypothetical protein [Tissierellia bacterium]